MHRFCFECFDVDGSGTIDEKEFVELCKYVHDPFASSHLPFPPPHTIIPPLPSYQTHFIIMTNNHGRVINNASPIFPKNFKDALESFDVNEDGLIDYAEFLEMEKRCVRQIPLSPTPQLYSNPTLFKPFFTLHLCCSKSILPNPNLTQTQRIYTGFRWCCFRRFGYRIACKRFRWVNLVRRTPSII